MSKARQPAPVHNQFCIVEPPVLFNRVDWLDIGPERRVRVVQQPRIRRPHNKKPSLAQFQAVIDIVVQCRQVFLIEPADLLEHGTPRHHAGGGDRRQALHRVQPSPISERVARLADIGVLCGRPPSDTKHDAGMLNPAIRKQQFGADRPHLRAPGQRHHFTQPVAVERRGVVVQQAEIVARRGLADRAVVHRREIERAGVAQQAYPTADLVALVVDQLEVGAGLGVPAVVVDKDNLVILV